MLEEDILIGFKNSLLEGELTKAQFARLKADLRKIIDVEKDSVVFYVLRQQQYLERQILGLDKGGQTMMI